MTDVALEKRAARPLPGAALAIGAGGALVAAALLHIGLGAKFIPPGEVWTAIFSPDPANFDHQVISRLRLPRLLIAMAVGACLGLAGATIQALTRNPLAGPGILGMNAGAALAVVAATTILGTVPSGTLLPWIAAGGALVVFALVMGLASAGQAGPTPLKITLAGVALSAFAGSITSAILIFNESTLEQIRLWLAGNLAGRTLQSLALAGPAMAVGAVLALAMSMKLNALALGERTATSLGVSVNRARLACLLAVALLTGGAVAVAGPIGFIGLVVPHIVKLFVPNENRVILPLSALIGALVLVVADIIGRLVLAPQEVATGLITALVGAPIFVLLVRTRL